MKKTNEQKELKEKIIKGLGTSYERLIEYIRAKNSVLVVMRGDNIVKIKP